MPFSDLFKTSSPKEPEKPNQPDSMLFEPEMQKRRYDAAMEFIGYLQERTPLVNGKPHAGSVLAVTSRLAGTSLFRSLNYENDLTPGIVILSNEVNEAWPQLMNIFAYYCKKDGIDLKSKPLVTQFPEKDRPRLTLEQVLDEYQDQYHGIMKKHGLDYLNGARAGVIVSSIVFNFHCVAHKDIDPYVAAGIVGMGIVEGAKTAPPALGAKPRSGTRKMVRLLLGDPDVVRKVALATGAIYIELSPEVLKILQGRKDGSNLIYSVYEDGVRKQMEERIDRIDFIKADVDKVFEEWRNKPLTQAPIHVRLIFWLKENAGKYDYEQRGNSWVLR